MGALLTMRAGCQGETVLDEAADTIAAAAIDGEVSEHENEQSPNVKDRESAQVCNEPAASSFQHSFTAADNSMSSASSPSPPRAFHAEWPHARDRVAHARAHRAVRIISWWYVLGVLGVIRLSLTLVVMLGLPVIMKAAMQNPAFWISLVVSKRARRARAAAFWAVSAARYACTCFVLRRVVHLVLAALIMPGTWLLGDARAKESWWTSSSLRHLRHTILQRCAEGRRWLVEDRGGIPVDITSELISPESWCHQRVHTGRDASVLEQVSCSWSFWERSQAAYLFVACLFEQLTAAALPNVFCARVHCVPARRPSPFEAPCHCLHVCHIIDA